MLDVGGFSTRTCHGHRRRAFLRTASSLPLTWGLSPAFSTGAINPGKAKSILLVWLWGGPSHLDMFDPKPKAPLEYRGPFSTISTATPGLRFSELLPKTASLSNDFSLVRSHINHSGDHLLAGSIGLTGGEESLGGHPPNFGSIVAKKRISETLPPFVSLADGPIGDGRGPMKGYGGGSWGKAFDPFMVHCSEQGSIQIPALKLIDGLNLGRLDERKTLLKDLDELRRQVDATNFGPWDNLYHQAYGLLTSSDARKAFQLSEESEATRESYGFTSFGQSCLLGRRLVESGIPYVQVNWSQYVEVLYPFSDYGWDTHADNFELLAEWHLPILDRAFSTLLRDLSNRGLLETTLVVCIGEFGRTPRINSIGSRDHWPQCYSSIWAGAGVQPGRTIGESDRYGEHPITDPVTPATVGTTMLELSGISSRERAELKVLPEGRVLHELL